MRALAKEGGVFVQIGVMGKDEGHSGSTWVCG